jgi:hypothetical protein
MAKRKTATPTPATPAPLAAAITAAYGATPEVTPVPAPATPAAPAIPPEWARPISLADIAAAEAVEAVTAAGLAFGEIGPDILAVRLKYLEWVEEGMIGVSPWKVALPNLDFDRLGVIHSVVSVRVARPRAFTEAFMALKAEDRPRPSWRWLATLVKPAGDTNAKKPLNASECCNHLALAMKADAKFRMSVEKAVGPTIADRIEVLGKKKGKI